MNTITGIPAQTLRNVALVGNIVTFENRQYKVYSVEGYDYYAFISRTEAEANAITCDFDMTASEWHTRPSVQLIPTNCTFDRSLIFEVPLAAVRRGVCLDK